MEVDVSQGALLAVDDAEAVAGRAPERTVRVLFEHPLLDATWSVFGPGEPGAEPHVHRRHVDAFYVVEGELRFGVGPELEPVDAPAATFVLVPPGVVHAFDNASGATARWLNFHAPSTGFLAYLRGERERFDSEAPPPDGGRSAADAVVTTAQASELLGDEPSLSAREIVLEPGAALEPDAAEGVGAFFVLEGEVELTLGGRTLAVGPGTWLAAPPNAEHAARNASSAHARILSLRASVG